jgi:hypothetical protein
MTENGGYVIYAQRQSVDNIAAAPLLLEERIGEEAL